MRWLALALLLGCAGPTESTPAPPEADDRWWHGAWVVDEARLAPDEALSPAARQTARALAATFADRVRFDLGPERVRRVVAGAVVETPLTAASVGPERVVLTLAGGQHLVLERGDAGPVLSDADGSRPVRRP